MSDARRTAGEPAASGASEIAGLSLDPIADVLDGIAQLAPAGTETLLNLAGGLISDPFVSDSPAAAPEWRESGSSAMRGGIERANAILLEHLETGTLNVSATSPGSIS